MKIYPAIDLMDGKAVRLRQGRADARTVYSDRPVEMALRWEAEGGQWLHIVDLDAAFGTGDNLGVVADIVKAVKIPCQVGGGMRDQDRVARALGAGVRRVVIGSAACESPGLVAALAARFGSPAIAAGVDAKDGFVAIKGWTETTRFEACAFAAKLVAEGAGVVIYTDIATDGMLAGPNLPATEKMKQAAGAPLIASGGVGSLEDIRALAGLGGLDGVIVGKALYDSKITLADAIAAGGAR